MDKKFIGNHNIFDESDLLCIITDIILNIIIKQEVLEWLSLLDGRC